MRIFFFFFAFCFSHLVGAQLTHEAKIDLLSFFQKDVHFHYELGVHKRHSINIKADFRTEETAFYDRDTSTSAPLGIQMEVASFDYSVLELGLEYRFYVFPDQGLDGLYLGAGYFEPITFPHEDGYEEFYEMHHGYERDFDVRTYGLGLSGGYKYLLNEKFVFDVELWYYSENSKTENPRIPATLRFQAIPLLRLNMYVGYRF